MPYIFDFGYLLFLLAVSPVILWRALILGKYREGISERFFGLVPVLPKEKSGPRLWLHAVSVGEVNLLKPLLKRIAESHPNWEIVISATSKTGYELAKKSFADRIVFRCPLDFHWATERAMKRLCPDLLVLAELEIWPNLLLSAKRRGVRVAVVNGRISDASFPTYHRFRFFLQRFFRRVDRIVAQDQTAADRFLALGAAHDAVAVTGSMKFDGARTDRRNEKTVELARLAGISDEDVVFLAGSSQEPEEKFALETFRELAPIYPKLRLILVPRHPERFDAVARLLDESGLPSIRRTKLGERAEKDQTPPILLVDTVGELGAWWGTARIAFVGGSMGPRGGQNMIEPAAYGAAVSFGPNTKNFRDISTMMIQANAAEVVADQAEMTAFVRHALADPSWAESLGGRAKKLVVSQQGATAQTVGYLEKLI